MTVNCTAAVPPALPEGGAMISFTCRSARGLSVTIKGSLSSVVLLAVALPSKSSFE